MTADLDVPLSCPNATAKAAFARAVKRGTITWHAGPMNMQVRAAMHYTVIYRSIWYHGSIDMNMQGGVLLEWLSQYSAYKATHRYTEHDK